FEYIFWRIRGVNSFWPSAGIISGLIIFLLADPAAPIELAIGATFLAVVGKQFIRLANAHIFNPAAFGLLAAGFLGLPITWWGVSWGYLPLALTILGAGYVSLFAIRQYKIVFSFLVVALVGSSLYIGHIIPAINQMLVGAFWFFALVMLPEPMTAAKLSKIRIFYGSLIALLPFTLSQLHFFPEPLLASLLVGNLAARIGDTKLNWGKE
ncbi:hypothetical protein CMO96_01610, partial [Candidatus Woesebacteria bacterium]|nr:hypothetical protein [Candidatus Woesebacteria bacterium]